MTVSDPPSVRGGSGPRFSSGEVEEGVARQRDASERRAARRRTAEARRERRESRQALRRASRAEALAAARRFHRGALDGPVYEADPPDDGQRVEAFLGDFSARIDRGPNKYKALMESTLPLRGRDEDGSLRPADLGLESDGDHLQPRVALTPIEIAADPRDGVMLVRAGVRLVPLFIADGAVTAVESDRQFTSAATTDTSYWIQAVPGGAESFLQLLSELSPEEFAYRVEMPDGAELALNDRGEAEIRKDGELLAILSVPAATDADGEPLVISWRLAGPDELVLEVPHRGRDLLYPILADPIQSDGRFLEDYTSQASYPGFYSQGLPTSYPLVFPKNPYGTGGLLIAGYANTSGTTQYVNGQFRQWLWQAQGTSYVYRAEFAAHHSNQDYSLVTEGIWKTSAGTYEPGATWNQTGVPVAGTAASGSGPWQWWTNFTNAYHVHCVVSNCAPRRADGTQAGGSGNMYAFTLGFTATKPRGPGPSAFLSRAAIFVGDPEAPTVPVPTVSGFPAGWTNTVPTVLLSTSASDPGLGVGYFNLFRRQGTGDFVFLDQRRPVSPGTSTTCTGDRLTPCPGNVSISNWPVPTAGYPDGDNEVFLYVYDPTYNATGRLLGRVKLDRAGPALTLSGSLYDSRNTYAPDMAQLTIDAVDGTGADPRSGVKNIRVLIDGVEKYTSGDQACAEGSCPLSRTFVLDPQAYTPGTKTVTVESRDQLSNLSTQTFQVLIDGTPPAADVSGDGGTDPAPGEIAPWFGPSGNTVIVQATDNGSGIESAAVLSQSGVTGSTDTQACPAGGCSIESELAWEATTGNRTIHTRTTDRAGNVSDAAHAVRVDADNPSLSLSGDLWDARNGILDERTYQLTVSTADDAAPAAQQSGINWVELTVDGYVSDRKDQECETDGCSLVATFDLPASALTQGAHTIAVTARDLAGNEQSTSFTVTHAQASSECNGNADTSSIGVPCPDSDTSCATSRDGLTIDTPALNTALNFVTQSGLGLLNSAGISVDDAELQPKLLPGSTLVSAAGTNTPALISLDPTGGLSIGVGSQRVCLLPQSVSTAAKAAALQPSSGSPNAAVFPATQSGVDTIVRAASSGLDIFKQIQNATASETFSWRIPLSNGQTLRQVDAQTVAIVEAIGDEGDSAEPAPPAAVPDDGFAGGASLLDPDRQQAQADYDLQRALATSSHAVAVIRAPWARDSSSTPQRIPVTLEKTSEDTVAMRVAHQGSATHPVEAYAQVASPVILRVLTWNLHNNRLDSEPAFTIGSGAGTTESDIVRRIKGLGVRPDVVVLPEVCYGTFLRLKSRLGYSAYSFPPSRKNGSISGVGSRRGCPGGGTSFYGTGVLIRSTVARQKVQETLLSPYAGTPNPSRHMQYFTAYRGSVPSRLYAAHTSQPGKVVYSPGPPARYASNHYTSIAQFVKTNAASFKNKFVVGDLNVDLFTTSSPDFRDYRLLYPLVRSSSTPGLTYGPKNKPFTPKFLNLRDADDQQRETTEAGTKVDYILTSRPRARPLSTRRIVPASGEAPLDSFPTDHFGLYSLVSVSR